jgi:glycosyltransferase involved in cell wall biosynthesis
LLFVEAGYFGCPVISTRRFAIPEIVEDGSTGVLLDELPNPVALAGVMSRMLEHTDEYRQMREAARLKARRQHSKERFEERLCSCLGLVVTDVNGQLARSR